jgi:CubicO group peptidase (beta-lactamase class C family)
MIDEQQVDEFFKRLVGESDFSAAVLVADRRGIVLRAGYGQANDVDGIPVTAGTIFDIGSIAKQFTAAAVLYLESQGLLDIRATIDRYLEKVPDDKKEITLHHLLTHTAGFVNDHSEDDLAPLNKDGALRTIFGLSLGFEPGTEYCYANSGYTLLAAIIEVLTGVEFPHFMRDNFFRPVMMESTGFYNHDLTGKPVANTYFNAEDQGIPSEWPGPYWGVMGNGGVLSTVDDLYSWWQALQNHEVLSPGQTEKLFTRHVEEFPRSYYGYGWTLQETPFGELIMHNGGGIGGNSEFAFYRDHGIIMIITSNRIVIATDRDGNPTDIYLPATKARSKLAYELFG